MNVSAVVVVVEADGIGGECFYFKFCIDNIVVFKDFGVFCQFISCGVNCLAFGDNFFIGGYVEGSVGGTAGVNGIDNYFAAGFHVMLDFQGIHNVVEIFHFGEALNPEFNLNRGCGLDFFAFGIQDGDVHCGKTEFGQGYFFASVFLVSQDGFFRGFVFFGVFFDIGYGKGGAVRDVGFRSVGNFYEVGDILAVRIA